MSKDKNTLNDAQVIALNQLDDNAEIKQLPFLVRQIFSMLKKAKYGSLTIKIPTGQVFTTTEIETGPKAYIILKNWGIVTRTFRFNSIGTAESYFDGDWDSPDPAKVLEFALMNWTTSPVYRQSFLSRILERMRHWTKRNTKTGSKRNIAAHYDLGNEFYAQWLDASMTYSSAMFEAHTNSLEKAQKQKYAHLAQKIGITPDDHVLEIGCGWGGFAQFAAEEIGCKIKGITISREQLEYAQKRIFKAGLNEKVELVFQDYRDESGQYDHVASIEMIEAVGEKYWPSYYQSVSNSLKQGGRAGIQAISINDNDFETYRNNPDFIQRYIFPGGMLLSPKNLIRQGRQSGLEMFEQVVFGLDYAKTLFTWREQFTNAWPTIENMGFDEKFKRMWEFYLAYCEAGFRAQTIDVRQVIYQKI